VYSAVIDSLYSWFPGSDIQRVKSLKKNVSECASSNIWQIFMSIIELNHKKIKIRRISKGITMLVTSARPAYMVLKAGVPQRATIDFQVICPYGVSSFQERGPIPGAQ